MSLVTHYYVEICKVIWYTGPDICVRYLTIYISGTDRLVAVQWLFTKWFLTMQTLKILAFIPKLCKGTVIYVFTTS